MAIDPADTTRSIGEPAPRSAAVVMLALLRSLIDQAPMQAAIVLLLTFLLILTSGVSLVMLVPLLGVAGLDVGGGSVGRLAALASGALGALGLSLTVPVVIGAYLAIVTASAALGHTHGVRGALLHQRYVVALRIRVYAAIIRSRWASYVQRPSSSFVHVLTQEAERVSGAVSNLLNLIVRSIMAAIYLALALYVSWSATLLVAACGGVLMALLAGKTRLGRARGAAVSSAYAALYGAISEHLAGLRITKSHGIEPLHIERFTERTQQTADAQMAVVRNHADVGFFLQIGSAVIMAAVFGVALVGFEMPLAGILLLLFLFARLVPMLTGLQRQLQSVLNLLPAVDRVDAMMAWLDDHAEDGHRVDPSNPEAAAPALERALRLERVGFGYAADEDGQAVLHDVDLEVPAGHTVAIVGPSGGGKSTVADLVVGLLMPSRGRVSVDGVPLDGARVRAWRRRIGYVNQEPFLFNDTIRANLLLVRDDASEGELRSALASASAAFVDALPNGIDTVVGDRGVRLSGGERQRVALARAILRRPALLVLDEATSALDPENERVIQEAIARMAGRQTILLIAHRLASVRGADMIYVLEQGRVVESGGWDELVRRPEGRFHAMCRAQGLLDGEALGPHAQEAATVP